VPSIVIDNFTSAAPWTMTDPGGIASAEVGLAIVPGGPTDTSTSLRVETTSASAGHRIERTVPAVDLTEFLELRLWVRSDRAADGSPDRPLRLRIQLGSAALAVGAPGNLWHRLVPVASAGTWELVRLALDDLDPLVASATDTVRITVEDHTVAGVDPAMTVWLHVLIATENRLVADATAALIGLIDGSLVLAAAVPARLAVPGGTEPAAPWIRVVLDDVAFSDARTTTTSTRTDVTENGFRLRRESIGYDLRYRIEAVTTEPGDLLTIVEHVVSTLAHRRTLQVNGADLPLDRLPSTERDRRGDVPVLRYVITARTDVTDTATYVPVSSVELGAEVALP